MIQAVREESEEAHRAALREALSHARLALGKLDEVDSSSIAAVRCQWLIDEIVISLEE